MMNRLIKWGDQFLSVYFSFYDISIIYDQRKTFRRRYTSSVTVPKTLDVNSECTF